MFDFMAETVILTQFIFIILMDAYIFIRIINRFSAWLRQRQRKRRN